MIFFLENHGGIMSSWMISGYGTTGQMTAWQMIEVLKIFSLSIRYCPLTDKFTILESSRLKKEQLEHIFAEKKYEGWYPHVLEETDKSGNRMVQLKAIAYSGEETSEISSEVVKLFRTSIRDNEADQLVINVQNHLGISLRRKSCLDVGCRSGENMLAMQRVGASVLGIDPNDSEFATGLSKGLREDQLVKSTLQKYHSNFPSQKFEIATVFLWNIPYNQRESFATALSLIIKPSGYVIIGYAESQYNKEPSLKVPDLMRSFFCTVECFVFKRCLNRYLLKCSK